MSNLHPIMQAALAPFAPPKRIPGFARPPLPTAPEAAPGLLTYVWDADCSVPIVCHLEPGIHYTLVAAYVRDVDVLKMLPFNTIMDVEDMARLHIERGTTCQQ